MKIFLVIICILLLIICFHLGILYIHAKFEVFEAKFMEYITIISMFMVFILVVGSIVLISKIVS